MTDPVGWRALFLSLALVGEDVAFEHATMGCGRFDWVRSALVAMTRDSAGYDPVAPLTHRALRQFNQQTDP